MSKDITVLTPNGRRVTIHCTLETSILQILEDVCLKQGFTPEDFDLKHHNKIVDLSSSIRYSNLPNKACLEMVANNGRREESNVTIGLQLDDGDRVLGDFSSKATLFEVTSTLANKQLHSYSHPAVIYMRHEINGIEALKVMTLRKLGLISGRAVLRFLNKPPESSNKQANVSSALSARTVQDKEIIPNVDADLNKTDKDLNKIDEDLNKTDKDLKEQDIPDNSIYEQPSTSKGAMTTTSSVNTVRLNEAEITQYDNTPKEPVKMEVDSEVVTSDSSKDAIADTSHLERRLNIESEVTFIGAQKAIAFFPPSDQENEELQDLPDDFYDLTLEEVRRLYHNLQQQRQLLENAPLLTANLRENIERQDAESTIKTYKHAVIRVQFPDRIILQGIFLPTDKIVDIISFIKDHLTTPDIPFKIFTTPLKEYLDPSITLLDAKFVPGVLMHFKWIDHDEKQCLKEDTYSKLTSSDAANILASKYRAPTRVIESTRPETRISNSSISQHQSSKVPKWFKK